MVEEAGSFDETLSKGWLTTDILVQTLDKLANQATGTTEGLAALSDEQLKNAGYTEEHYPDYVRLPGGVFGKSPLENIYGGF